MIPILYQENETNFNTNGIGMLYDTISYKVIEDRNASFELELDYPAGGRWASELSDLRLISAKPNDEDESHLFRIYEIVKNLEEQTITVYAASKSNDLGGNLVQKVSLTNVTLQQALTAMKAELVDPTSYNFVSDIQTLNSVDWEHITPLTAILGTDNSSVKLWGGEVKRTNDTIFVYSRRGTDKVTTIRPGKGLDGFKMTTSTKGMITSILPFVKYTPKDSETEVIVRGTRVNSPLMNNYPVLYLAPIDYSYDRTLLPEGDLTKEQFESALLTNINAKASTYFTTQNPGCDKPKVTIDVTISQLSDSSEYEQFKKLEHIALTDSVIVWVEKYNVDVEVTINSVVYNGMSEMVESFKAGNAKTGLMDDVRKHYDNDVDKIKEYVSTVENGIYNTIRITAEGKNNIFSGYTEPDESLVKEDDIWYKPVADGEIEMYRWANGGWVLAVGNASKLAIGTIDANIINLVNLNASNISTGTLTGANGGWNLNTGDFWLGSSLADASLYWDGASLKIRMSSGQTVEEAVNETVDHLDIEYYLSSSSEFVVNGVWSTTAPDWVNGWFMWTRTKVTYKNGESEYQPSPAGVCVSGSKGTTGKGVSSIVEYYYSSTSSTELIGGSWDTTPHEWVNGRYSWTKSKITYTDNSSIETDPICVSGASGYTPVRGVDYFDGVDGNNGSDGASSYLWVRYSQNASGNPMTTDATGAKYIGVATTTVNEAPGGYASYKWNLVKGTDGTPGEPGNDGKTSYLHIKYSNNGGSTFTSNNGETVGDWIGTYVDFVQADSSSPSTYTWNKVKGEPGYTPVKGTDYFDGKDGQDGTSSYLWVRYSQNSSGSGMTTDPTGAKYIGTATTTTQVVPAYTIFKWSLIKGTDGLRGEDGADGTSSYLHIKYSNDGGANFTANSGETVGEWIGTCVNSSSADPSTVGAYTWNKVKGEQGERGPQGPQGQTGQQGKGISSTVVTYQAGSSGTTAPTGTWSETVPSVAENQYLWTRTVITYTDSQKTTAYSVGKMGAKGSTGSTGATGSQGPAGKGISSTTVTYQASASGTTTPTGTWSATVPTVSANQYLWTRIVITYTDTQTTTSYAIGKMGAQGPQGAKGDTGAKGATGAQGPKGDTGTSVDGVVEYYLATSAASSVTTSTDGWTTAMQTMTTTKKYLWNYEVISFSDGSTSPTIPVIIGVYGNTGSTGATGRSLTSVTEYYLASASASGVNRSTDGWTTTMQTTDPTKKYLWNYEKLTWSSGTTTTYVEPIIIGIHGEKGATGSQGPQGIQGPKGANGTTYYTWIKYADTPTSGMNNLPDGKKYMGIAHNKTTATESSTYADYTWSLIQGPQGDQGVQGPIGPNGQPTYTWVKYADTATGSGMNDSPTGKRYIGLAFNKTTPTESSTASHYNWSPLYDNVQVGGRNLLMGSGEPVSNGTYNIASYDLTDDIKENEEVTLTIWGELASTKTNFRAYNSGGSVSVATLTDNGDGTYNSTFKWKVGTSTNTYLNVYAFTNTQTGISTIDRIKLERGNIATDWTPAPEDIETRVESIEYDTTPSAITTTFLTEFSKADTRKITKGIIKLDKDGINVAKSTSEINTQLAHDGLSIRDNTEVIAAFGESGAIIPSAQIEVLKSPDVLRVMNLGSISVNVGPGYSFSNITGVIEYYFGDTKRVLMDNTTLTINVYGKIFDNAILRGITGSGSVRIYLHNASWSGSLQVIDCTARIYVETSTGTGLLKTVGNPFAIFNENSSFLYLGSLNIDNRNGTFAIRTSDGARTLCNSVDISGGPYGFYPSYGGEIKVRGCRGNVETAGVLCAVGGTAYITGTTVSAPTSMNAGSGFIVTQGTVTPTNSAFNPPPVTTSTFTQKFTVAQLDTLVYGTSNVDSYYGSSAAQNRWDSSMGWKQGRVRFGSEIYSFFSGGSSISVKLRLRRKNSSHGSSAAVKPAISGVTFSTGALRGQWVEATVSSSLFGSGGADIRLYSGVTGSSGYAIWDAAEVVVTVTKTI